MTSLVGYLGVGHIQINSVGFIHVNISEGHLTLASFTCLMFICVLYRKAWFLLFLAVWLLGKHKEQS